jgi:hypothetical protein
MTADDLGDLDLERFFAAHREPSDTPDAMATLRRRTPPRHRARRSRWKPPLVASGSEPVQPQHANHSDTFVR